MRVLLDQVILERQRLFFVVDQDVVDVGGLGNERAGFRIGKPVVVEVAAHPASQILRLADVDYGAVRVFVEIHSGQQR